MTIANDEAGSSVRAKLNKLFDAAIPITTGAAPLPLDHDLTLEGAVVYEVTTGGTGGTEVIQVNDLALDSDSVNIPASGKKIVFWLKTRTNPADVVVLQHNGSDDGWMLPDALGNAIASIKSPSLRYGGASIGLVWGYWDISNTFLMTWGLDCSNNNSGADNATPMQFDWRLLQVDPFNPALLKAPPTKAYIETAGDALAASNQGGGGGQWVGGAGDGAGAGGYAKLLGGPAGITGRGGGVQCTGADGGETSGDGGNGELFGGNSNSGAGGSVLIQSGNSSDGVSGDIDITVGIGTSNGNLLIAGIPTADPHIINAIWSNAGVLTISAGP